MDLIIIQQVYSCCLEEFTIKVSFDIFSVDDFSILGNNPR